jgi:hypothetical protein
MAQTDNDVYTKHEADFLMLWVLKDLGWVLVLPFLCVPAGVAALALSVFIAMNTKDLGTFRFVMIELTWLTGNVMWMMADMFLDDFDYHYHLPYRMVPVFGDQFSDFYDPTCVVATAIFFLGIVVFVMQYAKIITTTDDREAWGMPLNIYKQGFIGFWILKDIIWIQTRPHRMRPYIVGIVFGVIAFAIIADYLRRYMARDYDRAGLELVGVELLWILANVIWMTEELPFGEDLPGLRFVAGAVLLVSAVITVPHTTTAQHMMKVVRGQDAEDVEKKALLVGKECA